MKLVFSKRPDQIWKRRELDGREILMRTMAVGVACVGLALVVLSVSAVIGMVALMVMESFLYIIGVLVFAGITILLIGATISFTVCVWEDEL